MLFAVTVAEDATARSGPRMRILSLSLAVLLGSTAYAFAFLHTQPPNVLKAAEGRHGVFILTYFSRALLYGGLATAALYFFVREREETRALHEAKLAKVSLDRQMIEARLQALQAQIEPHFLFNTLANIRLLYETEFARAKPLIHDLAAYLRAALPQMREARSTLARELALAQAYLRVLQVRMGERLKVEIDVPAGIEEAALPPMMLATLVENAIKHGLSPLPQGGSMEK
jgi:sensor histidine kinase YesM